MSSKLTFHDVQDKTAWQYLIRKKEESLSDSIKDKFWLNLDLSLNKAFVDRCDRDTAEKIIKKYEWLGDMAITNIYYGIFFDVFCGGCICINSHGVMAGNGRMYGLNDNQISYFARGACAFWTPVGTASKLLSFALKKERDRGAKVAHAFADTDAGEYGTVYQATNWICLGKQRSEDFEMSFNGKNLHSRAVSLYAKKNGISIDKMVEIMENEGWVKKKVNPKYRYCYILANGEEKKRILDKIGHLITEYPKR